jgi:hypothetical protein
MKEQLEKEMKLLLLSKNSRRPLIWTKFLHKAQQTKLKLKMESLMLMFQITKLKLSCLSELLRNFPNRLVLTDMITKLHLVLILT